MLQKILTISKGTALLISLTLFIAFLGFLVVQPDKTFAVVTPSKSDYYCLGSCKTKIDAAAPSASVSAVPSISPFAAQFVSPSAKHPCTALPPGSGASTPPAKTPSKSVSKKVGAIKKQIKSLQKYITKHKPSKKKVGAIKKQIKKLQSQIKKLLSQTGTPSSKPCPKPSGAPSGAPSRTPSSKPKVSSAPKVSVPPQPPVAPPPPANSECLTSAACTAIQGVSTATTCGTAGAGTTWCTLHTCSAPDDCITDAACGTVHGGVGNHCGASNSHTSCCTPHACTGSQACMLDADCNAKYGPGHVSWHCGAYSSGTSCCNVPANPVPVSTNPLCSSYAPTNGSAACSSQCVPQAKTHQTVTTKPARDCSTGQVCCIRVSHQCADVGGLCFSNNSTRCANQIFPQGKPECDALGPNQACCL